jgi:hypothetical protein
MSKPKVFISSTIYDFQDLRSSLKYYLEELGYEVNLSDFNDFRKEVSDNSYSACLRAVEEADYFILLVGTRTGGIWSKETGTTITQEEYRVAYKQAQNGKTRILAFVRNEVWTIKEDRKALADLLRDTHVADGEISADSAKKLANHASKFATDADRIFNFINEIARTSEMKKAIQDGALLPPANWVHCFKTFGDIVDALRIQMNVTGDLQVKVLVDNLRVELLTNIAALSTKTGDGTVVYKTYFTEPFREGNELKFGDQLTPLGHHLKWMIMGSFALVSGQSFLRWNALDRCLDTGVFMGHDALTGNVERTELHLILGELRSAISLYMNCKIADEPSQLFKKYLEEAKLNDHKPVVVDANDFAIVTHVANCIDDILSLSCAIYKKINGDVVEFDQIKRFPLSPYVDQDDMLTAERVSMDDIVQYLAGK